MTEQIAPTCTLRIRSGTYGGTLLWEREGTAHAIPAIGDDILVQAEGRRVRNRFFEDFFEPNVLPAGYEHQTPTVTLVVDPLPTDRIYKKT